MDCPRFFISVQSCEKYELNGNNQALRDTCLKDSVNLGLEYKFYVGMEGKPREDVVVIDCHDDYWSLVWKTLGRFRKALETTYEYFFFCDVDTYFCVDRLLTCGFENYDYFGDFYHTDPRQPYPHESYGKFCQGGPGFFTNRRFLEAAIPLLEDFAKKGGCGWGYEFVMGFTVKAHPEFKVGDSRMFRHILALHEEGPRKTNSLITAHLSGIPGGGRGLANNGEESYNKKHMYRMYQEWLDSFQGEKQ